MSGNGFEKNLNNENFLRSLLGDLDKIDAEVRDGSEGVGALVGGGVGAAGSFAALYGLGIVGLSGPGIMTGLAAAGALIGGGAAAGVLVLAAPVAGLAVAGYAFANHRKMKHVRQLQGQVLAKAIGKQNEIVRRLSNQADLSEAVVHELEARLEILSQIVESLQARMGS
ncbi:MAG: hypothetical protein H6739_29100 [Alphaproteobacteria bacterium]|nr:hypothetical protein [Alphaproteobacteria bacterium]